MLSGPGANSVQRGRNGATHLARSNEAVEEGAIPAQVVGQYFGSRARNVKNDTEVVSLRVFALVGID